MQKNYFSIHFLLIIIGFCATHLNAQQDVFSRSEVSTGNWGDGQLPWFYPTGGNQGDPDNDGAIRNFVKIGHNNNKDMITNGRFYIFASLDFELGASVPRTINNAGGGLSASGGIYNASSATHTFNTPIGIDGSTVQLHVNASGGMTFNETIFINNNSIEFGNLGTGEILVNGIMEGTGNVIKAGSNLLTFTNNNLFTGTTTVQAGTLKLQGSISESDVTVQNGATLEIDSNVTLKSLTVNSGGNVVVNAGQSLSILNNLDNSGSFTLKSSSELFASLIVSGTSTGQISYERFVNSNNNGNDLITPPVNGQSWSDFLLTGTNANDLLGDSEAITTYLFGPFQKLPTSSYITYTENTIATLETGSTGYRVATDNGSTLTFSGNILTGTQSINIIDAGTSFQDWNLIGNVYTSYVDIKAFLEHEVATGVTNISLLESASGIYGYDGNASDGWDIITLANDDGRFLTPGQGFFVAADANDVIDYDLQFTPAMQSTMGGDDFIVGRTYNSLTYAKINASTATEAYNTEIYFDANASLGLDEGYDAVIFGGTAPSFALYTHLVEENTGLPIALQAVGISDVSDVTIPLGVNANQGEQLTFTMSESALPSNIEVYLDDTLESTSILLNSEDYVLTPSTILSGVGRFFLRFTDNALSTAENSVHNYKVFTDFSGDLVTISGVFKTQSTIRLYDLQGREVLQSTLKTNSVTQSLSTAQLSSGVYIVKVENEDLSFAKKVVIR